MNALDLFYLAAAGATAPWWLRKRRAGWSGRFGHVTGPIPEGRRILLHAVSVGEVNALRGLVPALAQEQRVVVSAGTDTGLARAEDLFGGIATIVRYPLDASWSVRRFLDAVRPACVGLIELEVWPNFVRECERRGIPVAVINGRLSERSFRGYRRIRPLIRPTFRRLSIAAVQDEAYRERFIAMGVDAQRCTVSGSMKWDSVRLEDGSPGASALAEAMGIDRARPLIVAGSTGPGEEALLHTACPPGVQLLCAPRRPERFDEAAAVLPGCVRRSAGVRTTSDRFLLDSIGELRDAYSLADIVVIGRSFGDLYGSDPVEPVALGKATVMGPAASDFASAVAALEAGGGLERATRDSLPAVLSRLLTDPERRATLAKNGRQVILERQGATSRHAAILTALAAESAPGQASEVRGTTPLVFPAGARHDTGQ